jgi:hypothetical protein
VSAVDTTSRYQKLDGKTDMYDDALRTVRYETIFNTLSELLLGKMHGGSGKHSTHYSSMALIIKALFDNSQGTNFTRP